ncbi:MAG: signal peptidase I [Acidimicrobiales bacterium]
MSVKHAKTKANVSTRRHSRRRRVTPGEVIGSIVVAVLLAGVVLVGVAVSSGSWQIQPILSGSMQPGFPVGGVVVTQRVPVSSLQVRDVVLFHPPGEHDVTYVHRIISLEHTSHGVIVRTQGDDNASPDPWSLHLLGSSVYEARFTVPVVGYVAVWGHSPSGRKDILLAAASLLVLLAGWVLLAQSTRGHRRATSGQPSLAPAGDALVDGHELGRAAGAGRSRPVVTALRHAHHQLSGSS